MRAPDTGAQDATSPAAPPPWPVVRRPTHRFVRVCRALAVPALAYGVVMLLLAADDVRSSPWSWAAIALGGLVHLAGVLGLWFLPPRAAERVSPRPGPDAGTERERRRARRALRAGRPLDPEQRRLVAVEVAAGARVPVVAAAAIALLGPVVSGAPNASHPLPWLGPVTAAVVLLIVAGLVLQVRSVRRLHRAARRADALPRYQARDAPYLP